MNSVEYEKETRQTVMMRDKYKCVLCRSTAIQVHEIVPRSRFGKLQYEILFNPKNRVCLCQECHAEAHNFNHRRSLLALLAKKYHYAYPEPEFQRYINTND